MSTKINWKSEKKNINEIRPDKRNPRKISGKKFEDLKESIEKFGLAEPLVVNADGTLIGGHARYQYMKQKGETEVDVFIADRQLTPDESKELLVRLNKNVAGEWDFDILGNEFELDALKAWGFEDFELGFMKDEDVLMDSDDLTKTMDSYLDGNIKQIVLFFQTEEYEQIITKLDAIMEREGLEDHTAVFLKLLDHYENNLPKKERN